MVEAKRTCPDCNLIFEASLPETGLLTCPLCDTVFSARPPAESVAFTPLPSAPPAPSSIASAKQVWQGCLAVGALLFLVGGLVYAYRLVSGIEAQADRTPPAPAVPQLPPEPHALLEINPLPPVPLVQPIARPSKPFHPSTALRPPPFPKEFRPPATLPDRVNQAIERGVAYLRKHHKGHDQYRNYLGLLGLTLLECGVPAEDPSVRQIAAWLRAREQDLMATYELSLAILFLDRLDDPHDRALIRTFGQRLLVGQQEGGAWTYSCLVNGKRSTPGGPNTSPHLPQIVSWKNAAPSRKHSVRVRPVYRGDNSNTQFAILGLWVAQRHGVPARQALLATEQYFRQTQASDGSWSYHPATTHYRDSMTCAGLMSLAMRYGVVNGQGGDIRPNRPAQVSDRAIQQGLRFLDRSLDKIVLTDGRITGVEARDPLYFLYSIERMAVIYDRKTIGGKEWYPWAAEMLVAIQRPDGRWHTSYTSPVGTCFALLILKRSNVAHDLQLTVQESKPRRDTGLDGPTILQGREAVLGATTGQRRPAGMSGIVPGNAASSALGPTIIHGPRTNPSGKK
jgi:hypothetical protein